MKHDALVGMNVVVMDGAEVGAQSIVAACAFVPAGMKIAPRSLVVGMPARMLRTLSDDEIMRKRAGTLTYQVLTARCLQTVREVTALPRAEADRQRLTLPGLRPLTTSAVGRARCQGPFASTKCGIASVAVGSESRSSVRRSSSAAGSTRAPLTQAPPS